MSELYEVREEEGDPRWGGQREGYDSYGVSGRGLIRIVVGVTLGGEAAGEESGRRTRREVYIMLPYSMHAPTTER